MLLKENFKKHIKVLKEMIEEYIVVKLERIGKELGITEDGFSLTEEVVDMRKITKCKNEIESLLGTDLSKKGAEVKSLFVRIEPANCDGWFEFSESSDVRFDKFVNYLNFDISTEDVQKAVERVKKNIDEILTEVEKGIRKIIEMRQEVMKAIEATSLYEEVASERIKRRLRGGEQK